MILKEMVDRLRDFAINSARIYKSREKPGESYEMSADILLDIADMEKRYLLA
ncbi:MAG: hypothetical protein ACKVJP_02450 [Flavobacteriales bacterium]|tara:strand:- start:7307 stop:7462 length:156 start_codon:yes stop_codon:yes gene_type:complete